MKIFLSSVRRGLEEERDALPGMITAIGHTPVRFEDFSAQAVPSREACLAGIASSDVYLLILGPNYGHSFGDTGQSPTHDEWVAATKAGLPRLVYRKTGVPFEPEQEKFTRSIGDYASGVFYDDFATTAELLTKVVSKVRELEAVGSPLAYSAMSQLVTVTWRSDFDEQARQRSVSTPAAVEVHVVPIEAAPRSMRVMAELEQTLPTRIRDSGLVAASEALSISRPGGSVVVSLSTPSRSGWNDVREPQLLGVRLAADGQVSAWAALPGDSMGPVLDAAALSDQIAGLLRLIGLLRTVDTRQVAIGVGIDPAGMLSIGCIDQLPRTSATGLIVRDEGIRIAPDELVSVAALDAGALEVGRTLSRALLDAVGHRRG